MRWGITGCHGRLVRPCARPSRPHGRTSRPWHPTHRCDRGSPGDCDMTFLTDTLGPHWLALGLLAVAAVAAGRRWHRGWGRAVAFACGTLGLGGLALDYTRFDEFDLPLWLALGSAAAFELALARLVWTGAWSFTLGLVLGGLMLLGLGGVIVPDLGHGIADAVRSVRGLEFVRPW